MKVNRVSFWLLGAVCLCTLGVLFLLNPFRPPEVMPHPNGYEDFRAASSLVGQTVTNWDRLARDDLRLLVTENAAASRLLRVGLAKECKVQPYFLTPSAPGEALILARLDRLAQVLAAEARLAILENRTNDAVSTCLLWIRYGQERGRGGPIWDDGSGTEIQTSALAMLARLVDSVDPSTAQEVAATLEAALSRGDSAEWVWERDRDWLRRGRFGWAARIHNLLDRSYTHRVKRNLEQRHAQLDQSLRRVTADFVSRSNRLGGPQP